MKILIATAWSGAWPYLPEMVAEFRRMGEQVEIFDTDDLGYPPLYIRLAMRSKRLASRSRIAALKYRLSRMPDDFDVVNIHYVSEDFAALAPSLKRRGKALISSVWGSEFLRATDAALNALSRTFDLTNIVTSNNPEVSGKMAAWRGDRKDSIRIVRFGLGSLDRIAEIMADESREETHRRSDIPLDKLIVACGYNAGPAQNHGVMAEALRLLTPDLKAKFFALVPLTYPANAGYVSEVRRQFESSGVAFRIFDKMQDMDTVCRMRIACDAVVNVQSTDSLSASIQEHMFVGSRMVVGKWLPYGVFEEMGVPLSRVGNAADIARALEECAARPVSRPPYSQNLYEFSSWSSNAPKWLQLYADAAKAAA
jgi:hypothetical protein